MIFMCKFEDVFSRYHIICFLFKSVKIIDLKKIGLKRSGSMVFSNIRIDRESPLKDFEV